MGKNAFENLLEALPDTEEFEFKGSVRKAMESLAEKVPKLKDSVLAQADYSRRMDQVRDQVALADQWNKWADENWNREVNMPIGEVAKKARIDELEAELETARKAATAGGDEMTFEQLNQRLEQYAKEKSLLTKTDLDALITTKEKDLQKYVAANSGSLFEGAMITSELNLKHAREFGEPFDSRAFIKSAVDKGRMDLVDYYEKDFVIEKRQQKVADAHKAELEKAAKERDDAVKALADQVEKSKTQAMGNGGITDSNSPDMGPLQKRMLGEVNGNGEGDKAPEVPMGSGGIASWAARRDEAKAAGRV